MADIPHKTLSDQELIQAIQAGGAQKERAASSLYQQLEGYVYKGMNRYRMHEALAREAFHLALQKVVQAIEFGQFEGKSKISTYFHPIFFHRCVDILRRESSYKEGGMEDYMNNLPDKAMDILRTIQARDEMKHLHGYLDRLGEKCKRLLIDTEWHGKTLKEVAEEMQYASASVAGTSKNRCLQKLKSLIRKQA